MVIFQKIQAKCSELEKRYIVGDWRSSVYVGWSSKPNGLPWWLSGRGMSDPWVGKIPWKGKWQPLQYSCWRNPMEEPGRLQAMECKRIGYNLETTATVSQTVGWATTWPINLDLPHTHFHKTSTSLLFKVILAMKLFP